MQGPSSREIAIAGPQGRLSVDDGGAGGLPVLLVHGNGGNRTQWAAQLAHLRSTRRAAALDLRGMGQSALPANGDYGVEGFAEDVAAVADSLGLRLFVLVGHSFGGAVVAAYAGRHAERLAGIVFADSAGDLRETPPEQIEELRDGLAPDTYATFTETWFNTILKNAAEQTRASVLASLRSTPRQVFTAVSLGLYEFSLLDALQSYQGPRLSITSYLADHPLAIHRAIPEIPVAEIRDASHWLMMDRPKEFNRALDIFLRELESEAAG